MRRLLEKVETIPSVAFVRAVLFKQPVARKGVLVVLYSIVLSFSLWVAYELRFDFKVEDSEAAARVQILCWFIPLRIAALILFRQFQGLLSYFSIPDLARLAYALILPSVLQYGVWLYTGGQGAPPRSVILIDLLLACVGMASIRIFFRMLRERYQISSRGRKKTRRVAIVGAGDVGASLARELLGKPNLGLLPVIFLDDDRYKWGSNLHGVPVLGSPEDLLSLKKKWRIEEAILAMPSAPPKRIGEIVKVVQEVCLKMETVPSLHQLATGKVKISQLRSVEIQDLLGREPIELETENIRQVLQSKVVMVTGAGGSIGSELCRQIARFNPSRLLLLEQSEVQLFQIEQEMIGLGHSGVVLALIADVLDSSRIHHIFERYKPEVIFHAAAHKHVQMMESQPGEAIKNNTMATAQLAELAMKFKVERFVMISTDKAINPTSVMGATKRLAEIFVQALHATPNCQTKFMAVRFGNVLGSSGSVVPIFQKQIAAGGPVKVTAPDVIRYFMTIPEAVGLVLQSGTQGDGGEIFVLDMGKPVKIIDLANQLIELNGLIPGEDIEIEFIGLRPGEKLFEELSHNGEHIAPTSHPKVMRFNCQPSTLKEVRLQFEKIKAQLQHAEANELKLLLKEVVPEYEPYLTE